MCRLERGKVEYWVIRRKKEGKWIRLCEILMIKFPN